MNFLDKIFINENNYISPIVNPFIKNSIKSLHLHASNISQTIYISGTVEFENGNTKGEQKFTANTLDELLYKIKIFIDNMNE